MAQGHRIGTECPCGSEPSNIGIAHNVFAAQSTDKGMVCNAHRSALMAQGYGLSTQCPPGSVHRDMVPLHNVLGAQSTDTGMVRNAHRNALLTHSTGLWAPYTMPSCLTAQGHSALVAHNTATWARYTSPDHSEQSDLISFLHFLTLIAKKTV
ncbi:zinc finger and BTB domain-containing protein 45 [Platysternon megacephalum]|uniref:Zinc finger and BTB domain-containing protein 45 n=1 Tax=Platysternon megacephalum TaxID=55544 RepID=A0A4D9DWD4_9SAUR|nr:zinc finger and BTB domain-containing protein 45 [Platysternon megacephalum]